MHVATPSFPYCCYRHLSSCCNVHVLAVLPVASSPILSRCVPPVSLSCVRGRCCTQSVCAFVLKANMECRRHNYRKAIRLLGYASGAMDSLLVPGSKDEAHSRAMYLHNVGCVFFRMNRFAAASVHFSRALELCEPWRNSERWGGNIVATSPGSGAVEFSVKPPGRCNVGLGVSSGILSPIFEVSGFCQSRVLRVGLRCV